MKVGAAVVLFSRSSLELAEVVPNLKVAGSFPALSASCSVLDFLFCSPLLEPNVNVTEAVESLLLLLSAPNANGVEKLGPPVDFVSTPNLIEDPAPQFASDELLTPN